MYVIEYLLQYRPSCGERTRHTSKGQQTDLRIRKQDNRSRCPLLARLFHKNTLDNTGE